MLNIADTLHRWCRGARPFALATVVDVRGSAPLPTGTSVAVDADGNAVGSISGGCVEGAVYELCRQVLDDGGAPQRAWFGYSDDDAFAVGLTCGGELDVLVQRVDPADRPHLGPVSKVAPAGRRLARAPTALRAWEVPPLAAPAESPSTSSTRASGRHADSTLPHARTRARAGGPPSPPPGPPFGRTTPLSTQALAAALDEVAEGRPAAVAQVVDGPDHLLGATLSVLADGSMTYGTLDDEAADRLVVDEARALLRAGRTARVTVGGNGDGCPEPLTVLVHVHASRPRMLVFGAVDFAAALSQAGAFLGYRVTVCDARPVFATRARFPYADEVVVDWPHRYLAQTAVDSRTAVCVLTHDAKFDIPLLQLALDLPVGYVGAMGSRRTHDERLRLLREAGVPEGQLARLRSPIGLDLGARTPEETAVSITAEIIAHTNQATGLPLAQGSGPIHRPLVRSRTALDEVPAQVGVGR
ncbi:XdhC family protein [Streptomyces sp. CA-288835]|uniref:XdhC family protein n=1 Tax=Streptomyces sp. CA-288835 TaxID=3240069 RepID=UPI003D93EEA8